MSLQDTYLYGLGQAPSGTYVLDLIYAHIQRKNAVEMAKGVRVDFLFGKAATRVD